MNKLEIVFDDFICVVIQPIEGGFSIQYEGRDYTIKPGENISLNNGDLYFTVNAEEKEGEK